MWKQLRRLGWHWRGVLVAAPGVAGIVIALRLVGGLQPLELAALDQFFRWRSAEAIDDRIVIVTIAESDVQQLRQWPMSDAVLAQLLTAIHRQHPRAIGLDLYRDLPVAPGHQQLVQRLNSIPNVIGIQKVINNAESVPINPPPTLQKRDQVSANDVVLDADGVLRRSLLSLTTRDGQTMLTLGARLALLYLQAEHITLQDGATSDQLRLGRATFESLQRNDGGYVQADTGGYQILANFRGLKPGFRQVTMHEVLAGQIPKDIFRDRLVLIGITADSIGDFFLTPYSRVWYGRLAARVSGVAVHADVASQILSAALEGRQPLRVWSKPGEWSWIFGWAVLGAIISWYWRYRVNETWQLVTTCVRIGAVGVGVIGVSYGLFLQGWWVPVVPAGLAFMGSALTIGGYMARSAISIRQTFSRYLTDEVVASLLETPDGLKLGGEKLTVTVLMADLRGFSAISERLSPEQTMEFVNRYLEIMTEVIQQYGGTINEFLGDGIMVMFGAPTSRVDDAERAVACAIAMQLTMPCVNQHTQALNIPLVEMGIGINTGEVLAGNIGSRNRAKYTILGNQVNLAARIESYTVGGQILVSQTVLDTVGPIVRVDGQMQVQAKGIQAPLTLYEIGGIGGRFQLALAQPQDSLVVLVRAIPVQYTVLSGKQATGHDHQGQLVKLSAYTAEMAADAPVALWDNLKLRLLNGDQEYRGLRDLYAKVIEVSAQSPGHFLVRFTAVPPEVATLLDYVRRFSLE